MHPWILPLPSFKLYVRGRVSAIVTRLVQIPKRLLEPRCRLATSRCANKEMLPAVDIIESRGRREISFCKIGRITGSGPSDEE